MLIAGLINAAIFYKIPMAISVKKVIVFIALKLAVGF